MTIETKYEVGQTVWLILKNQVVQGLIIKIEINVNLNMGDPDGGEYSTQVGYIVRVDGLDNLNHAEKLFATKADLIASL